MIVMGGIVGAGIFMNPYVVAQHVHTPALILLAWLIGGGIALLGAFVYAELAERRPQVGGQYAYLREAYHPSVAFVYGWGLLLVTQTGGMAAVAITFGRYFLQLTRFPLPEWSVAVAALALLVLINCLGVRQGSNVQSALMVLKIIAIIAMIAAGWYFLRNPAVTFTPVIDRPVDFNLFFAMGAALMPVMFSYGGWQTSSFVAEEIKTPRRNLPRALVIGVASVIVLYLAVNLVCVYALGAPRLAASRAPASDVMRLALGDTGVALISLAISLSTLGFLSQSVLTAPRVYFAMATDGLFFKSVGRVHPRSHTPTVAIILQGTFAALIAVSGQYAEILGYVTSVDFIFFGLTGICLFVFRRRDSKNPSSPNQDTTGFRVPGHPATTGIFVLACWLVVISTFYAYPKNSLIGWGIMLSGIPVYWWWHAKR